MSDTPKTDALWDPENYPLMIEHARRLERELAESERQAHNAAQMAAETLGCPNNGRGCDVTWRDCEQLVAQVCDRASREAFALAATQCSDPKVDERGHSFCGKDGRIAELERHNKALRDVLFEVARLWPTVKDAPADVVVARCEAISAAVATTLYELSKPAGENDVEAGSATARPEGLGTSSAQIQTESPDSRDGGERPATNARERSARKACREDPESLCDGKGKCCPE